MIALCAPREAQQLFPATVMVLGQSPASTLLSGSNNVYLYPSMSYLIQLLCIEPD